MRSYLIIILIGLVAGFIGSLPLLRAKADKYAILGAFVLYFMMPYIIFHMQIPSVQWWLKGSVISLALVLPLVIVIKKSAFTMLLMAIVVGGFITFLGHYLL